MFSERARRDDGGPSATVQNPKEQRPRTLHIGDPIPMTQLSRLRERVQINKWAVASRLECLFALHNSRLRRDDAFFEPTQCHDEVYPVPAYHSPFFFGEPR